MGRAVSDVYSYSFGSAFVCFANLLVHASYNKSIYFFLRN